MNTSLTTSVAEIEKFPLKVYSDPATNELTIEFEGDEYLNVGILMFNILGEVVFSSSEQNRFHKTTIDISTLAAGIYFMEVDMEGERLIRKIVKQ